MSDNDDVDMDEVLEGFGFTEEQKFAKFLKERIPTADRNGRIPIAESDLGYLLTDPTHRHIMEAQMKARTGKGYELKI